VAPSCRDHYGNAVKGQGAAKGIEASGKPTHLYYFGDYDPSGLDIT